jgi:hypothetical protein
MSDVLGNDVITIVNEWTEPGAWQPPLPPSPEVTTYQNTVIKGVQWEDTTDKDVTAPVANFVKNSVTLLIPGDADFTDKRKFLRYELFATLPKDQKPMFYSMKQDMIIFQGEVPPITDSYTLAMARAEFRYTTIKAIKNLNGFDILPHFEIIGV